MISHDFDFQIGAWTVRHRRLKARLTGCTDWDAFDGTSTMQPILGGNGNLEDNLLHFPGGDIRAIALRSFEPVTGEWAIWWLASTDPHRLDVPVKGRFADGVGSFYSNEDFEGRPVMVRFLWLTANPRAPRWEQALSEDGGETWETNWTMDFTPA